MEQAHNIGEDGYRLEARPTARSILPLSFPSLSLFPLFFPLFKGDDERELRDVIASSRMRAFVVFSPLPSPHSFSFFPFFFPSFFSGADVERKPVPARKNTNF